MKKISDKGQDVRWEKFKEEAAKFRNGPLTALITRRLSIRVTFLLRNIDAVTPNIVTFFSLIIFLGGIPFFIFGAKNYLYMVIGVLITQFAYVLDCSDGELARYRGQTSKLGAWLDSVFDRIKEGAVFFVMTLHTYMKTHDEKFIFIGFLAFVNVIIAGYITDTKVNLNLEKTESVVKIGKKYLIGLVEIIIFGVAFFALVNDFRLFLLFFAFAGPLMWIYQMIVLTRRAKNKK